MVTAVAAMCTMYSCRDDSDDILSYGQNDNLAFAEAGQSFEEQFKAIWTALNCNYGIWDYEAEHGVDWDEVYDTYLPKMQELDKRDKASDPVKDIELARLYKEIIGPLHDGHFVLQVMNLHSGKPFFLSPSQLRNASRPDFDINSVPPMDFYLSDGAGNNKITDYAGVSVKPSSYIKMELEKAISKLDQLITELENKAVRTDLDDYFLNKYKEAFTEFKTALEEGIETDSYNSELASKYDYLGFSLNTFDISKKDEHIDVKYAVFNNDIVYFGFTGFFLSPYFSGEISGSPGNDYYANLIKQAWEKWYVMVQGLHRAGKLKGVIIDVRNNGGGNTTDYQFVLGALLPPNGHQIASARFKTGIGRYDYSPLTPVVMPTLPLEHETITEPVVVLANCHSVSMAEVTCLGAKQMANARVIGTRTWGGMCMLMPDPSTYSFTYASAVGVRDETPFWAYIPSSVTITEGNSILEGVGVTPDIEVQLDKNLLQSTGRDTQLERALQYIRTGN